MLKALLAEVEAHLTIRYKSTVLPICDVSDVIPQLLAL